VLEGFPDLAHDDEADACSGALELLNPQMKCLAQYEVMRRLAGGETLEQIAEHAPTTPERRRRPAYKMSTLPDSRNTMVDRFLERHLRSKHRLKR
jgi:hypothetical protein